MRTKKHRRSCILATHGWMQASRITIPGAWSCAVRTKETHLVNPHPTLDADQSRGPKQRREGKGRGGAWMLGTPVVALLSLHPLKSSFRLFSRICHTHPHPHSHSLFPNFHAFAYRADIPHPPLSFRSLCHSRLFTPSHRAHEQPSSVCTGTQLPGYYR